MESYIMSCRQVIYTVLDFGEFLLWDEAYKKYYIDVIADVKKDSGIEVYAFSVFSGRVFMLSGRFGQYSAEEAWDFQHEILKHFLALEKLSKPEAEKLQGINGISMTYCLLEKQEDILQTLIYIHLVAMNQGYVRFGFDYWWSSVQTYRSHYMWKGVDSSVILESMSANQEHARRVLIRRHHDREHLGNPVPSCLKASLTVNSREEISRILAEQKEAEEKLSWQKAEAEKLTALTDRKNQAEYGWTGGSAAGGGQSATG